MLRVKKSLSLIMTAFFILVVTITNRPVSAAVKSTPIPKITFQSQPKTEYKAGDIVYFKLYAPGYSGRVQYRVVLWHDETKSYRDLWTTGDRYYKNWQPYGNEIFNLHWGITEPGNYRITIYAKRAGVPNNKTALKGYNSDSYMAGVPFVVKPKERILGNEGVSYGSNDAAKLEAAKEDIKITAKNITYSNASVEGNLYINADNSTLNNVSVQGTVFVNPGEVGTSNLNNVTAKSIKVLSGGTNSINLNRVKSEDLTVETSRAAKISAKEGTSIKKTVVNTDTILEANGGSFGNVEISNKNSDEKLVDIIGKFDSSISVKSSTSIKTIDDTVVPMVEFNVDDSEAFLELDGRFKNVVMNKEAVFEVAVNSVIENLTANADGFIYANKNSLIKVIDKKAHLVYIDGEGKVESIVGALVEAPKSDSIIGTAGVDISFGKDIYEGEEFSALIMKLKDESGKPLATTPGKAYISFDTEAMGFDDYPGGDTYSIPVYEEDGTLEAYPGNYVVYVPVGNKYYTISYVINEYGELTSVNGQPYNYQNWTPTNN